MTMTRTVLDMTADVRKRADMVGSNFRDDAAIMRYLSESCRSLVTFLVDKYGEDYWNETTTVPTVANQSYVAFPAAASKISTLRVTLNGVRDKIPRADVDDLDVDPSVPSVGWGSGAAWPAHRVRGSKIVFVPVPVAVHVITVEYVPTAIFLDAGNAPITEFAASNDKFDGVFGWEEWPVLHTAIKLKNDEKKDSSGLEKELAAKTREIIRSAQDRMTTEPARVRDTWRQDNVSTRGRQPWWVD